MLVCYTHRLGVVSAVVLKSLFYQKISDKVSKTDRLSENYKQKLLQSLSEQSPENDSINFSKNLKMDYHEICSLIEGVTDALESSNMYLCLKNFLKKDIDGRTLTLEKALSSIEKIYAATLLDKGKTLIYNCNYGFIPSAIRNAAQKGFRKEISPELEKMPLYFNMQYFMLEHGSRKLIEPHILQEMFLLRYFYTLETFKEAKVLKEDDIKTTFKAYM